MREALVLSRRAQQTNIEEGEFVDLLVEAYDKIQEFLRNRSRDGLRVYQNPPVSLAFGLGALVSGLVRQPVLMARAGNTYVPANVWED